MLALLFLSAFPAALLIAAMNDLMEFKIPNWASVVLFLSYFAASLLLAAPMAQVLEGTFIFLAVLAVGFALFATKTIGAGDAKLLAAAAPWVGLSALMNFILNIAVAGALFAMILMVFRQAPALPVYARAPWLMRLHERPRDMPYGVAIAIGGMLTFADTPNFQLAFGG